MARSDKRFNGALDDYRVERKPWRTANAHLGRPAIFGARRVDTGQQVIIKQWVRAAGVDDRELVEIWRDEIRHLYRLASYPGARDRLAMLIEPVEEPQSYLLVLDGEDRVPLATLLEDEIGSAWFRNARTARNRVRLWQEINRLGEALQILHDQGLIHRNLDSWSVLTSGGSEPDFLLTGFEWSMRLTSTAAAKPQKARRGRASQPDSFYDDWRALGVLASQILGFKARGKASEPYFPDIRDPATYLLASERELIATLLAADPLKRIDGVIVAKALNDIIAALGHGLMGHEPKLVMAIAVGSTSRLGETIRSVAGDTLRTDPTTQQQIIERDIQDAPRFVRLKPNTPGGNYAYRLIGRDLTYDIEPFLHTRTREESWWVGRCRNASRKRPPHALIDEEISLERWTIEFTTIPEADRTFGAYQGRTVRWDQLFPTPPLDDQVDGALTERTFDALLLVQIVEALALAADIYPVRIVGRADRDGEPHIEVRTRDDPTMTSLSNALGLAPPAARLAAALGGGQRMNEEWRLAEEPGLGLRESEHTSWNYIKSRDDAKKGRLFVFQGSAPPPSETDLYLRVGGPGHDSLVKRRLKALKNLREHTELLSMLSDPAGGARPSHDPWDENDKVDTLDASKSKAFEELWAILPLYLIQGPPGVGKTRLVQELVLRRLRGEPTERLLLTAQSHSAVDHLLEKIRESLEASPEIDMDELLPLRCRPRDRDSGRGDWDVDTQADKTATKFAASALVAEAPQALRTAAAGLAAAGGGNGGPNGGGGRGNADRAFSALLLRSANLVFASSNAGQLEQLVDERARFDWAIVEEAGKATGVELIAPLLLSHRRLMIGDHKQLPPFNSEAMLDFLAAPSKIRDAVQKGRGAIVRQFAALGMEDLLDRICSDDFDIDAVAPRARDLLMMFESLIHHELGDKLAASPRGLARRLEHQHRMHPTIADLVSSSFYDGAIITDPQAAERFAKSDPPVSWEADKLPVSPILFIDTPFARDTVGMPTPETAPFWTNRLEAELCCDLLAKLQPEAGKTPSLAVLSPYRFQVRAIEDAIEARIAKGELSNLKGFAQRADGICHTVDSFQGNEADIVVISLVRNNHHAGKKGLGFLANPKRMNVLISRARWKLILLGSWDFLQHRFAAGEYVGPGHDLRFLRNMLDAIEDMSEQRDDDGVPLASILSAASVGGRS